MPVFFFLNLLCLFSVFQSLTSANAQVLLQSLAAQAAQPGGQYASTIAAAAHSQLTQLLTANPQRQNSMLPQVRFFIYLSYLKTLGMLVYLGTY